MAYEELSYRFRPKPLRGAKQPSEQQIGIDAGREFSRFKGDFDVCDDDTIATLREQVIDKAKKLSA